MKKSLIFLVAVVVISIIGYTLTTKWRGNDNRDFVNTKYGYSLQYPAEWNMRGSAQSEILQFFNTENPPGDGGIPSGILMEVMVLENYDNLSLDDWVEQMNTYGPQDQIANKDQITAGGERAIRQTNIPRFDEEGPPIGVYFARGNNIFVMQYLGSNPDYSENFKYFENALRSFSF